MKSIIEEIYYGNLSEVERGTKDFQKREEYKKAVESYDKFEKTFNGDQMNLFNEWYINETSYLGLIQERTYVNGFKTGMLLVLELLNFEPAID